MSDQIKNLLNEGRIKPYEYDIYMLYEANDLGRRMLKEHLMRAVMEDPTMIGTHDAFPWMDGRRSVWREINLIILKVNMEKEKPNDSTRNINANPTHQPDSDWQSRCYA